VADAAVPIVPVTLDLARRLVTMDLRWRDAS
jgi:hypothetical protein